MIVSSQSFSMIQRRISLSPLPASPVKSGEPFITIAIRLPPFDGLILASMVCKNRSWPSLMRESRAKFNVFGVLAFNKEVGFCNRKCFGVDFLAEHFNLRGFVYAFQNPFFCFRKHAAGSTRRIINGFDNALFFEDIQIAGKEEINHEADDFSRGKVLSGIFV